MPHATYAFTSHRLRFRRLEPQDSTFFHQLANGRDYLAFIGDRGIRTEADATHFFVERIYPGDTQPWLGTYAMVPHDSDTPIGTIGIYTRPSVDVPDLGFALLPEYYRKGYTEEAARALLAFAKTRSAEAGTPLKRVAAIALPHNTASVKLLEKLGFTYERMLQLPKDSSRLKYFEQAL